MKRKTKMEGLDNLELLSLDQQKSPFPSHYHDTFCISLVREGMEILAINDQCLHTEKGQISITNPYEVHANPLVDSVSQTSFDTLYLSQDVMDHFGGGSNLRFHQRQFSDQQLITRFLDLKGNLESGDDAGVEVALADFITLLGPYQSIAREDQMISMGNQWEEITAYIQYHLESKISLKELAGFANMEKFHFAKTFKSRFGLSPLNFVLMQKVFAAKALISVDTNFTALAYQFGFADQAHFSKTFKRFIGLSPRAYRSYCRR